MILLLCSSRWSEIIDWFNTHRDFRKRKKGGNESIIILGVRCLVWEKKGGVIYPWHGYHYHHRVQYL